MQKKNEYKFRHRFGGLQKSPSDVNQKITALRNVLLAHAALYMIEFDKAQLDYISVPNYLLSQSLRWFKSILKRPPCFRQLYGVKYFPHGRTFSNATKMAYMPIQSCETRKITAVSDETTLPLGKSRWQKLSHDRNSNLPLRQGKPVNTILEKNSFHSIADTQHVFRNTKPREWFRKSTRRHIKIRTAHPGPFLHRRPATDQTIQLSTAILQRAKHPTCKKIIFENGILKAQNQNTCLRQKYLFFLDKDDCDTEGWIRKPLRGWWEKPLLVWAMTTKLQKVTPRPKKWYCLQQIFIEQQK